MIRTAINGTHSPQNQGIMRVCTCELHKMGSFVVHRPQVFVKNARGRSAKRSATSTADVIDLCFLHTKLPLLQCAHSVQQHTVLSTENSARHRVALSVHLLKSPWVLIAYTPTISALQATDLPNRLRSKPDWTAVVVIRRYDE